MYFSGIKLYQWIIIHSLYELGENTTFGIKFINDVFGSRWPGGKSYADAPINMLGDTISSILGWYSAYCLDQIGKKYKWYDTSGK